MFFFLDCTTLLFKVFSGGLISIRKRHTHYWFDHERKNGYRNILFVFSGENRTLGTLPLSFPLSLKKEKGYVITGELSKIAPSPPPHTAFLTVISVVSSPTERVSLADNSCSLMIKYK